MKRDKTWLFFAGLALVVLGWFGHHRFILSGDLGWPQFFSKFFYWSSYVWDGSVNYGYAATRQVSSFHPYALYGWVIQKLLPSGAGVQPLFYYVSFAFSGYGMYLLAGELGLAPLGAVLAGFFYMFSPYAAVVVWVPAYGITFPFYCFLPLVLFFFLKYMRTQEVGKKALYVLATSLSYFGTSFSNPAFFLAFVLFIGAFAVYLLFDEKRAFPEVTSGVISYGGLLVALNAFWIFPLLCNIAGEFSGATNQTAGLISDLETVKLCSVRVADALSMTGLWVLRAGQWGDYYYDWHNLLTRPSFIIGGFVVPFLAVLRCAMIKKYPSRMVLLMIAIFLVGILLNSGYIAGGLLKPAADLIYSASFLQRAYRSVYLKVAVFLVIPLVILAADALEIVSRRLWKGGKMLLCALVMGLLLATNAKPFIDGTIIKSEGRHLPAARISIPDEYYDLEAYDSARKLDARYLSLPIPVSYNQMLKWRQGGYSGGDFLRNFLGRPLVFQHDGKKMTSWLVDCINDPHDGCRQLLGLLNIKYVFQHKDISPIGQDYYLVKRPFEPAGLRTVMANRYFALYDNQDMTDFLPHIYAARSTGMVWNVVEEFDDFIGPAGRDIRKAIYSYGDSEQRSALESLTRGVSPAGNDGVPILEYKKINPTKYRIRVHRATGTIPLVFSESFDPGWQSFLSGPRTYADSLAALPGIGARGDWEQADQAEIRGLIKDGSVTNAGADFISKNIQGTIQNDNLPNGYFWETWFGRPVHDHETHYMVNGYANSWLIDTRRLCAPNGGEASGCVKNPDGTYDFELVLQHRLQRFFHIGALVSVSALLLLSVFVGCWARRVLAPV